MRCSNVGPAKIRNFIPRFSLRPLNIREFKLARVHVYKTIRGQGKRVKGKMLGLLDPGEL
ncbi:MAG TPA: hypothetical protein VN844_14580 [Pyrinomonadaceae bacterium]|nr:hypothetical protein [Pyrinomonadaceae bacterium]